MENFDAIEETFTLYREEKGHFRKREFIQPEEAVMFIARYRFPGSLQQLKNLLQVPDEDNEQLIFANFAQHPQFTNGAEIRWEELRLQDSELRKEYTFLQTLPGCGRDDISQFCIVHIYPATLKEIADGSLKEQATYAPSDDKVHRHRKKIIERGDNRSR